MPSMKTKLRNCSLGFCQMRKRLIPPPDGGYAGGNTAKGTDALFTLTTGVSNTGLGFKALYHDTTGDGNAATGGNALSQNNADGNTNTAIGVNALYNTTGSSNTAIGVAAGDLLTGNGNVCIGSDVNGVAGEKNTTRIRNICETVQPVVGINPDYVTVDSHGRLGRANISSRRYKHDIKPMDKASKALFKLKPVSFRYNRSMMHADDVFGLIAEEVRVYPDLVGRNAEGSPSRSATSRSTRCCSTSSSKSTAKCRN